VTRSAAELAARLGETWNPAGSAVTAGAEDDRIILVPVETRRVMVVVHSVAISLLLDDRALAVRHLAAADESTVDFCVLRGTVLWRTLADEAGERVEPLEGPAGRAELEHVLAEVPAGQRNAWRDGVDRYRAGPWAEAERHRLLGLTAGFLSGLDPSEARGAALAAGSAFADTLLLLGGRSAQDLAAEQSALAIAFLSGDVMVHDGERVVAPPDR
jgi:hypothetical protein